MAKTWAERFPHPGPQPHKPGDEQPTQAEVLTGWWVARSTWNEYVRQLRRHQVAQSLDAIAAQKALGESPVGRLAMVFGVSYLDGSLPAEGPYVGLALL